MFLDILGGVGHLSGGMEPLCCLYSQLGMYPACEECVWRLSVGFSCVQGIDEEERLKDLFH